jgi:hypothetical protein
LRKEESPISPEEEREEEEGTVGADTVCWQTERAFLFQVPLKPTLPYKRAEPGGSHLVMNEWGGAWMVPSQVRVVWAIPRQPI